MRLPAALICLIEQLSTPTSIIQKRRGRGIQISLTLTGSNAAHNDDVNVDNDKHNDDEHDVHDDHDDDGLQQASTVAATTG